MARRNVQNRRHVRHSAERVYRQDGFYPTGLPHCLGETLRVHVEGALIYVDEQRLRSAEPDRIGRRRPGVSGNGHHITRADAESEKSQVQCRSAATHNNGIRAARRGCNLTLEGPNPLSLHQEAGLQDLRYCLDLLGSDRGPTEADQVFVSFAAWVRYHWIVR